MPLFFCFRMQTRRTTRSACVLMKMAGWETCALSQRSSPGHPMWSTHSKTARECHQCPPALLMGKSNMLNWFYEYHNVFASCTATYLKTDMVHFGICCSQFLIIHTDGKKLAYFGTKFESICNVSACHLQVSYYLRWPCSGLTVLTHWGLVTPYGDIDLGQHWLR